MLEEAGLGELLVKALNLGDRHQDLSEWLDMVRLMKEPAKPLNIAVVGKYVDLPDSYISVREALRHAGLYHGRDVQVTWVHSEEIERNGSETLLASASGIVVPGGFGPRGVEGMIEAARYA